MFRKLSLPLLIFAFVSFLVFDSVVLSKEQLSETDIKESSLSESDENAILFNTVMDVLTHQRCINCHPSNNVPKQGEDSHPHRFDISRNNIEAATNCNTCHQDSNNDFSGVPGAPHWALAPHNMRWEGLSRIEIAKSILDPQKNGNRSREELMHHLTEHELVMWAWEPGKDLNGQTRETPPVPKAKFISAVKKWIESGAIIPENKN